MALIASLAAISAASSAQATIIYSSDFSGGLSSFLTTGSGGLRSSNGVSYLGGLTLGSTASIALDLSGYTDITLSFDLYAIQSLDGDGPSGGGADPFQITQDATTLFDYTFANYSGASGQSYPNAGSAPKSGAYTTGLLGFGSGDFGDSEYHIAPISLASLGSGTTLTFIGNSNQGESDESYGINNVVVTGTARPTTSAVPEPETWAMMIAGLGLTGGAMRHRRRGRARVGLTSAA